MKSIKSKALFLGLSLFAFSAIHAQDTTNTPKPDTTTAPKPDTTKKASVIVIKSNAANAFAFTSFVMINDNKLAAKLEANDDKRIS